MGVNKFLGYIEGVIDHLIAYVSDRAGHDLRYAADSTNIDLGPSLLFEEGFEKTARGYIDNEDWLNCMIPSR